MKMFEFQILSEEEQIDFLYHEGVYVGKGKKDGLITLLYQLDNFYVEIMYRKYRRFIKHISTSSNLTILEPYLEQIDIALLVE